jgi:signal transduction histidine kinase/DNA-binding NarL/FixJ family response regulator
MWNRIDLLLRKEGETREDRLRKVSCFLIMLCCSVAFLVYLIVRISLGGFHSTTSFTFLLFGLCLSIFCTIALLVTKHLRWALTFVHLFSITLVVVLPVVSTFSMGLGIFDEDGSPQPYLMMMAPSVPATVAFSLRAKGWTIVYSVTMGVLMLVGTAWNPRDFDLTGVTPFIMVTLLNLVIVTLVLSIFIDVAEELHDESASAQVRIREAMAEARAERRANRAKTRFVSVMSHEIRNPLQAVLLQLDMLSYSKLNTAQRGYVDGMQRACGALLSIVNDILDVTKIDSGAVALESTPIVLRQLVEETVEAHVPTAVAAGIELVVTVEPTLDTRVVGDPTRIRQVLQNFLSNALKFTAEGEVEVLLTRGPEESEGEEGEKEQGSGSSVREVAGALWTMSVRDTGIGIDEVGQEKLFHEFSQVDESTTRLYGGTGLGLFICKELSSLMGGSVAVESERGVGSTFSASFRAPPAPSPEDLAVVRLGPSRVRWTVLVHAVNASLRTCVERYARFFLSDAASVDVQHSEFVRGAERLVAQLADATSRTNRLMVIVHYSDATTDLLQALSTRTPASCSVVMLAAPPSANTSHLPTISPRDDGWRHVVRLPVTLDRLCTAMDAAVSDHVASSPSRRYIAATRSTGSGSSSTTSTPSLHSSTRLRKVSVSSTGSPSSSAARRNAATVLIVDDFALIRDLVQELVRQLGYRTLVAANGEEAIALVTEHYESIGLVLMDCEMPICDGFQATDAIRALEADRGVDKEGQLFVCAMTGNASREDELQCAARGLSGFLAKPVSRADLETCLAQHVQLPTQRQRRPAKKKKKGAKGRKKQLT